jgi:hypothetical protein
MRLIASDQFPEFIPEGAQPDGAHPEEVDVLPNVNGENVPDDLLVVFVPVAFERFDVLATPNK